LRPLKQDAKQTWSPFQHALLHVGVLEQVKVQAPMTQTMTNE